MNRMIRFIGLILSVLTVSACDTWYEMNVRSMEPTINLGADIRVENDFYEHNQINRFDIVTFETPEKFIQTKRIIGLPSEIISIVDGVIIINGVQLEEPINAEPIVKDFKELTIPQNHYFILGDNRNQSRDSRQLGTFPRESIRGKVVEIRNP